MKERRFDIRLLAATNENLEKAISEGRFREDLFHRLNEFTIRVPLLSECPEDILPMARFFLERFPKNTESHFRDLTVLPQPPCGNTDGRETSGN